MRQFLPGCRAFSNPYTVGPRHLERIVGRPGFFVIQLKPMLAKPFDEYPSGLGDSGNKRLPETIVVKMLKSPKQREFWCFLAVVPAQL